MTNRLAKFAQVCAALLLLPALAAQGQTTTTSQAEPKEEVAELHNVEYARVGNRPLRLNLYRTKWVYPPTPAGQSPPPAPKPRKLPCVVWIHGGGWREGTKDSGALMLTAFARLGFVGASIEYRFTQEAPFPAQIEDCKAAIRFLRANAERHEIDPDKIGAWGISAGGHLAAMLATTGDVKELEGNGGNAGVSSRVQAACDWCGPTDLPTWFKEGMPSLAKTAVVGLIGGSYENKRDLAAKASPITYVSEDDPPVLIMHGDKDELVPLSQSQLFSRALERVGVKQKLSVIKGGAHVFISPQNNGQALEFFIEELKPPRPTPPPVIPKT